MITFQPDLISNDHGHILAQQVPFKSPDILNSMNIHHLSINSDTSPPPVPPRMSRNTNKISLDQQC
jgi:hypothetical protein